jgi:tol-pal system protein YbgF
VPAVRVPPDPRSRRRAACLGRRLGVAALALLALGACSSRAARKGEELRSTDFRLLELNRATEELKRDLVALRDQVEGVRAQAEGAVQSEDGRRREALEAVDKRLATMERRLESLAGAIRGIEMTVGGLADQVVRLEAVPATVAAGAANGAGAAAGSAAPAAAAPARRDTRAARAASRPAPAPVPPEELFARALESFKSGELGQAVLDFEDFVVKHPTHALAGTAQFWIGEAYYDAREYQHAVVEYRKAVDIAPKGDKTPDALYKLGLANRALKRTDRARDAWNQLLRDFPQSDAAHRARTAMRETNARPPRVGGGIER